MLFDHRTYTCKPGTLAKQLALYEKHGMAVQQRYLGKPLFYAVTETGPVNSYVHIWVYDEAADRARRRAAMQADPEWKEFLGMSAEAGCLVAQENKLMIEAPFFKLA
jgi:NIPSNAP